MKKITIDPDHYGYLKIYGLDNLSVTEYIKRADSNKIIHDDIVKDYKAWCDPNSDYGKTQYLNASSEWLNAISYDTKKDASGAKLYLRVAFTEFGDGKRFTVFYWSDNASDYNVFDYHYVKIMRVYDGNIKMHTDDFLILCQNYAEYKINEYAANLTTQLSLVNSMEFYTFRWSNSIFNHVYAPF